MKVTPTSYLVSVLSKKEKVFLWWLSLLWIISLLLFWYWWSDPSHIVSIPHMIFNSVLLLWSSLLPGYFLYFVLRMREPNPKLPLPEGRIAMVVTKAPSEPFSVLQRTLLAMRDQEIPHDTWLADEDPTPEVYAWCKNNGIFVSTRKNDPEYHRDTWPRRKKSKEGNLCYFYDKYGYDRYDFVVQLDADHVPDKHYLREMIRPFINPKVGYVSAPSICDLNAKRSWSARGRLYLEAGLHGPQQAGHTNGFAPLCFGSHYAVRTSALKEIGGLGPELAEDHSTTLMMNAKGWIGVHALRAFAFGDGPATFADAMTQEFQWSKSLAIILVAITKHHYKDLPFRMKFQFLFSQVWYPLFGIILLFSYLVPLIAVMTESSLVKVSYIEFLYFSTIQIIVLIAILQFLKELKLLRPINTSVISWEAGLFQVLRWPWVLFGSFSGIVSGIRNKPFAFKVTPKGERVDEPVPIRVLIPYIILTTLYVLIGLIPHKPSNADGYYYFVLLNAGVYFLGMCVVLYLHEHESNL